MFVSALTLFVYSICKGGWCVKTSLCSNSSYKFSVCDRPKPELLWKVVKSSCLNNLARSNQSYVVMMKFHDLDI